MWYIQTVLFTLLFLPTFVQAIFGGQYVTNPHEYPWLARLVTFREPNSTEFHGCGGSIISKNLIVTAAHCVENATKIIVILGNSNSSSELALIASVKTILNHPAYNSKNGSFQVRGLSNTIDPYDIALLRLSKDLNFNEAIQQITFTKDDLLGNVRQTLKPEYNFEKKLLINVSFHMTNSKFWVAGWGRSMDFSDDFIELSSMMDTIDFKRILVMLVETSETPKQLKKLELYLHTFYVKSDDGKNISFLLGGSLNEFFQGVCNGDSGSPLMRYDMITERYELGIFKIHHQKLGLGEFFLNEHSYSYAPVVSHFTFRYTNNISY